MMKDNKMLTVIKRPGEDPEVTHVENTLEALQTIVGGYIETVTICTDLTIICNEEGRCMGLPHNVNVLGIDFCGTILAVEVRGDCFCSLKAQCVPWVLKMMGGAE